MNKQQALVEYAEVIKRPCPECGKQAGKLCDTPFVWVHYARLHEMDPVRYSLEYWPL